MQKRGRGRLRGPRIALTTFFENTAMYNEFSGEQPSFNELHETRQGIISRGWREAIPDPEKYLCRIAGGPGAPFRFRAIHDRDKGRPSVNLYGTFEDLAPRLVRLNRAGYGIFVIINESTGTTDSTVTGIRAVFVDIDRDELPDRKARLKCFSGSTMSINIKGTAGLAPMSMIVESSPGKYHIYWHCHAMPRDRFKSFQRGLAHVLGGAHADDEEVQGEGGTGGPCRGE
jgi:hypothetical protein